uniref:Heat shock protein 70 n=1 Tax=Echinococcus granulosus TaxID=6210 RepID=U6FRD2_ECHGR|nr:heat shock protein 70 [Echinococcus granulosus]
MTGDKSKAVRDLILLEVTRLSLSVMNADGTMATVIKCNTRIPIKQTCARETASDYQTHVSFKIFEGEWTKTSDNYFLGEFHLTGFPAARRGEIEFKMPFEIEANGILHVSGVEKSTEKAEQHHHHRLQVSSVNEGDRTNAVICGEV